MRWDDVKAASYVMFVVGLVLLGVFGLVHHATAAHRCHQHGGSYVQALVVYTCIGESK